MVKKIVLIMLSMVSLLYSMGNNINYDDRFNQEEYREIDKELNDRLNNVTLTSKVYIEINGKNIPVKRVKVGTAVVYIDILVNSNSEARRDIVVKNPIPQGSKYLVGSAICNGDCIISYSKDGGATFTEREKQGEIYNYIEFYFRNIPAYKEFRMGFRAVVEG